jgi:hypothetical protein
VRTPLVSRAPTVPPLRRGILRRFDASHTYRSNLCGNSFVAEASGDDVFTCVIKKPPESTRAAASIASAPFRTVIVILGSDAGIRVGSIGESFGVDGTGYPGWLGN